jgi:rhodanese-related sulfurtransferase
MIIRILWQSTLLLGLAAASAWATWRWHPDRPELYLTGEAASSPDEITVAEALAQGKKKTLVWLDARPRAEFDKGHIPEALLLNMYEWEDLVPPVIVLLDSLKPETTLMVIYCDSPKCSASHDVAERMKSLPLGDWDIRVLHGGWPAWQTKSKGK